MSQPLSDLTNNQKSLVFYYFLRACDVKPRITVDLSVIAKGMHLLWGKDFTTINSSSFYKCIRSVPDLSNPKMLISDLTRIQPLFARVGLQDALHLIDYDLVLARHQY